MCRLHLLNKAGFCGISVISLPYTGSIHASSNLCYKNNLALEGQNFLPYSLFTFLTEIRAFFLCLISKDNVDFKQGSFAVTKILLLKDMCSHALLDL